MWHGIRALVNCMYMKYVGVHEKYSNFDLLLLPQNQTDTTYKNTVYVGKQYKYCQSLSEATLDELAIHYIPSFPIRSY